MTEKEQEVIDMLNELIRLFGEMQAILDDLTKRHEAAINGR